MKWFFSLQTTTSLQLTDFMNEEEYNDFLFFHEFPEELIKQSDTFLFYIEILKEKIYVCKMQIKEFGNNMSSILSEDNLHIHSFVQLDTLHKNYDCFQNQIMENKHNYDHFYHEKQKKKKELNELKQLLYEHYFQLHHCWNKAYVQLILQKQQQQRNLSCIQRFCICCHGF